jgi:HEAT repeat protein
MLRAILGAVLGVVLSVAGVQAEERAPVPGWVVRGMTAALTQRSGNEVRSEALRYYDTPLILQILQQVAAADRDAVIDSLISLLGDGNPQVRETAAEALGVLAKDNKAKSNVAIDALIPRLNDVAVSSTAAEVLGVLAKGNREKSNAVIADTTSQR